MEDRLLAVLERYWPALKTESEIVRASAGLDLFGLCLSVPLAVAGLVWLSLVTDLSWIREEWLTVLLISVFLLLFKALNFFFFIETPGGHSSQFDSSFESMVIWSATLILGPTFLWLAILADAVSYGRNWLRAISAYDRLEMSRNFAQSLATMSFASLVALALYQRWGGSFPIPGLTLDAVLPALGATLVHMALSGFVYAAMLVYIVAGWSSFFTRESGFLKSIAWGLVIGMGAVALVEFFAILAAGLYTENGPAVYFIFLLGLLLVAWLANKLSQYLERSQQRSREMARLEELGRAILKAPADASTLPSLLEEHVAGMFSRSQIEIRLLPEQVLLHNPDNWPAVGDLAWDWLRANPVASTFLPRSTRPWDQSQDVNAAVVLAPIMDEEGGSDSTAGLKTRDEIAGGVAPDPIGGIYLSRRWDPESVTSLLPAVQALAAQVASALHRAKVFAIERDMAVAGRIQASFLPSSLPEVPGWQLVAKLDPARETSGDFYDVVPLPDGRLAILVADVADKGTGAALYMALSRTLIRTYLLEHDAQPARALGSANQRILLDSHNDLFVTLFCGILDPENGELTYANGGHNPPYLFGSQNGGKVQLLRPTGGALGVLGDWTWEQEMVIIPPGDALVLYTDGVTEAQNAQQELFGDDRLLLVIESGLDSGGLQDTRAQILQDTILDAVHAHAGAAPQSDDITLMVVVREPSAH